MTVPAGAEGATADLIAGLVAEKLGRNCGPMVVADHVAEAFADIFRTGGGSMMPLYGTGLHTVMLGTQFTQRGSLILTLDVDGWGKVWSGELRAAARGS